MKKNLVFLTALKSEDEFLTKRHDDYSWMNYSIRTWKYWCEQHGHDFYVFDTKEEQLVGENQRIRFGIKEKIPIRVTRVNMDERKIDFELISKH